MKIVMAEHAGFCFGVQNAIQKIEAVLNEQDHVIALGEVVHNDRVNNDLRARGLSFADTVEDLPDDAFVILRTHGVPRRVYTELDARGLAYKDVTCPFVQRIHKIVAALDPEEDLLLAAGEPTHAETIGTVGFATCPTYVFSSLEELQRLAEEHADELRERKITVVSQTTFSLSEWESCLKFLKLNYTKATIFDTICRSTEERQNEAEVLSTQCDRMVVVGSRHSSNTVKLFNVCKRNCETCLVECKEELDPSFLDGADTVGVTAGASTPAVIIKEVLEAMSEVENKNIVEETETTETAATEDFGAMLEESFAEEDSHDGRVVCTVEAITPTEIQVAINGRKQTGFIKFEEYSYDPNVDPTTEVKVGDELNCIIMKTNDAEGTIMLSKKRFDSANAWDELEEALAAAEGSEEQEADPSAAIMEGVVTDINKGGVIATTEKGIRVFIPGSLATESRGEPLDQLLKTQVKFKIIEVDKRRKRAVGSIKAVLREERKAAKDKFWQTAEVGQTFTGVVKSLTSYGAFVDIGGVDGMIHISELSWKRIKHPSEVVSVGDTVEVNIKSLDDGRISLGYKKAEDNPWVVLQNTYAIGDVVDAKVVGMTTFGAFANILPGIDGLIHISQIADRRIEKPQDVLSVGEEVKVKIIGIDYDKKRVSLSIRQLLDKAPEEDAYDDYEDDADTVSVYDTDIDHPTPVEELEDEAEEAAAVAEEVEEEAAAAAVEAEELKEAAEDAEAAAEAAEEVAEAAEEVAEEAEKAAEEAAE